MGKRNCGGGLADPAFLIGNANDFGGHEIFAFQNKINTSTTPAPMVARPSIMNRKRADITIAPTRGFQQIPHRFAGRCLLGQAGRLVARLTGHLPCSNSRLRHKLSPNTDIVQG
jgi:hypothetical protein